MTIEQVLADPEGTLPILEKMSDEELLKHFSIHLTVTRPELAPKKPQTMSQQPLIALSPQKKAALAMLAQEGVDIGFMNKFRKKK